MLSKKIIFHIFLMLSIILVACSTKTKDQKSDFIFYNGEKSIGYGSSREDMDNIFGASSEKGILGNVYDVAKVIFRDNKAVYIIIEPDVNNISNNLWVTSKGIGIGSTEENLQKAYELTESDKYKDFAYDISLKADGDKLVKCAVDEREYILSFYLSGGHIYNIALCDIQAATTFK